MSDRGTLRTELCVYYWNGGMWCVLVEWWDVVCTSGMVGCGVY